MPRHNKHNKKARVTRRATRLNVQTRSRSRTSRKLVSRRPRSKRQDKKQHPVQRPFSPPIPVPPTCTVPPLQNTSNRVVCPHGYRLGRGTKCCVTNLAHALPQPIVPTVDQFSSQGVLNDDARKQHAILAALAKEYTKAETIVPINRTEQQLIQQQLTHALPVVINTLIKQPAALDQFVAISNQQQSAIASTQGWGEWFRDKFAFVKNGILYVWGKVTDITSWLWNNSGIIMMTSLAILFLKRQICAWMQSRLPTVPVAPDVPLTRAVGDALGGYVVLDKFFEFIGWTSSKLWSIGSIIGNTVSGVVDVFRSLGGLIDKFIPLLKAVGPIGTVLGAIVLVAVIRYWSSSVRQTLDSLAIGALSTIGTAATVYTIVTEGCTSGTYNFEYNSSDPRAITSKQAENMDKFLRETDQASKVTQENLDELAQSYRFGRRFYGGLPPQASLEIPDAKNIAFVGDYQPQTNLGDEIPSFVHDSEARQIRTMTSTTLGPNNDLSGLVGYQPPLTASAAAPGLVERTFYRGPTESVIGRLGQPMSMSRPIPSAHVPRSIAPLHAPRPRHVSRIRVPTKVSVPTAPTTTSGLSENQVRNLGRKLALVPYTRRTDEQQALLGDVDSIRYRLWHQRNDPYTPSSLPNIVSGQVSAPFE